MAETLLDLHLAASVCRDCALAERRTNVVFGEGDAKSPLVLVGEGPGDEEDRTGRPFIGKAGHLLDRALADAGLVRGQVYICNTVKCRAADWSSGKPVNRAPLPAEVSACRRWLVPQLGLIQPVAILCIGAASAKNLIKKDFKITRERGQQFPSSFARFTIAALHPSYILRNAYGGSDGGYALLVADIQTAWNLSKRGLV